MTTKGLALFFSAALLAAPLTVRAQSNPSPVPPAIPDDPDSLFGPDAPKADAPEPGATQPGTGNAESEAGPGAAPADASARLLKARAVEVGGTLISNYTAFLTWADAYPDLSDPASGMSNRFVPNLEADLYFDARPFESLRVFTKLKAVYPFSSEQSASGAPSTPLSPLSSGQGSVAAIPNISVFEAYADLAYADRLYFRAGQQVVNWGVGCFFSPADVFSAVPIDPMRPTLEREGPLALRLSAPFADVDNVYFYVVADRELASKGELQLEDLAVASRVELMMGGYEIGLGAFYREGRRGALGRQARLRAGSPLAWGRRPKAVATVTGSVLGNIGVFGEGVLSYGRDRILVRESPGVPGAYLTSADETTPFFNGTIGFKYLQADWHVSVTVQYYYNGQGYADGDRRRDAVAAYTLQLQGAPPAGPSLSASDVLQTGMHYVAGLASWTDILASKVDLALFFEGNLSDGSGVVGPGVAYTPFRYLALAFTPYFGFGPDDSEFVSLFGRFSLSLKLTLGEGAF